MLAELALECWCLDWIITACLCHQCLRLCSSCCTDGRVTFASGMAEGKAVLVSYICAFLCIVISNLFLEMHFKEFFFVVTELKFT